MDFNNFFEKTIVSETCISFRWNLNKVPKGCDQILLLAQLITAHSSEDKEIKLRPDKRKRAKGLIVVFVNDKPSL